MRYLVAEGWTYTGSIDGGSRTVRFAIEEGAQGPLALEFRLEDGAWVGGGGALYGEFIVDVLDAGAALAIQQRFHGQKSTLPGPARVVRTLPAWALRERKRREENGI